MEARKISFSIVMAAVMLIAALLVTNCLEPMSMGELSGRTVYVKMAIGEESIGRTIIPGEPTLSDMTYDITITLSGESTPDVEDTGKTYNELIAPRSYLIDESYEIEITAYQDNVIFGEWNDTISITSSTTTITVELTSPTSGNGTLKTNLTIPSIATLTTATLGVYALADSTFTTPIGTGGVLTLTAANITTGTIPGIPAGPYRILLTLAETGYETKKITDILHILPGLISTFSGSYSLNSTVHQITLDYNDDGIPSYKMPANIDNHGIATVNHGDPINPQPSTSFIPTAISTFATDKTIAKWTLDAAGAVDYTFGTSGTPIEGPITLYAKWDVSGKTLSISLSFTLNNPDLGVELEITNGTLSMSQATFKASGMTIAIDSTEIDNFDAGSAVIKYDTITLSGLTINSTEITPALYPNFTTPGTKNFTLEFTTGSGAKPHSKPFQIEITQN